MRFLKSPFTVINTFQIVGDFDAEGLKKKKQGDGTLGDIIVYLTIVDTHPPPSGPASEKGTYNYYGKFFNKVFLLQLIIVYWFLL